MEDLWENFTTSCWEMGDDNFFGDHSDANSLDDEEKFFTEIVQQQYNIVGCTTATSTIESTTLSAYDNERSSHGRSMVKSNSSNSIITSLDAAANSRKRTAVSSSPAAFILSFENSAVETAAIHRPSSSTHFGGGGGGATAPPPPTLRPKRTLNRSVSIETIAKQGSNKKVRSSSETQVHIIAERKRRQELTERFIALSATIPGLKKTDKAYILREAISYMKQLQERVQELENQNKRTQESVIIIKKSQQVCTKEETTSCETNSDSWYKSRTPLPQVEARVLGKEILIGIHCEKQKDIVLKIMALLQNLHLSLGSSSVLPFGISTLKVTVIAQMGDQYCMSVNDLVRNLRQHLLNSNDIQK